MLIDADGEGYWLVLMGGCGGLVGADGEGEGY